MEDFVASNRENKGLGIRCPALELESLTGVASEDLAICALKNDDRVLIGSKYLENLGCGEALASMLELSRHIHAFGKVENEALVFQ